MSAGSISFPLFRPCGAIGLLNADLGYQDQCATPRAAQDAGGLLTDASNVTLFVTPDRYVINDRSARWRFYVSAGGEITATTIVVTNTLPPGVTYVSHMVNSTSAPAAVVSSVISDSAIVAGRQILTFTIPANPGLPAGTRLRFDVYAEAQACDLPGTVDMRLTRACGAVAGTCDGASVGQVQLLPGVTSLLSSNNQTANLPLCEQGEIQLVVKNTSAASNVFNLTINDIITSATYVIGSAFATVTDAGGTIVDGLANIPFTPTVTSGVVGGKTVYTLTWTVAQFDVDSGAYKALALRAASDSITIVFKVQTDCSSDPVLVQSFGQTHDVCDLPLSFAEDSKSLITDKPDLVVVKQVRNATAGGAFGNSVFAGAGDSLTWQVIVRNDGPQRVTNLFVNDQLPDGATVSSVSPAPSSQSGTLLKWHEAGGQTLESDGLATYLITTTVGANACTAEPITNTARASYGCGVGEICLTVPVAAEALVDTKPELSVSPQNVSINQCGPGTIRIDFSNTRRARPKCGADLHAACRLCLQRSGYWHACFHAYACLAAVGGRNGDHHLALHRDHADWQHFALCGELRRSAVFARQANLPPARPTSAMKIRAARAMRMWTPPTIPSRSSAPISRARASAGPSRRRSRAWWRRGSSIRGRSACAIAATVRRTMS